jgi:hypothetical protein
LLCCRFTVLPSIGWHWRLFWILFHFQCVDDRR